MRQLVIFEAVGVPGMIEQAMRMAPRDARILVVGACMQEDRIHPMLGIGRELNIQFVLAYEPLEFSGALTAIADGKIDLSPWLTGTVGVDGVPQAFADLGRSRAPTPRSSSSPAPDAPAPPRLAAAARPGCSPPNERATSHLP
jgi:threonine dehydrogenase-like Zn-dependent dehydrogenase